MTEFIRKTRFKPIQVDEATWDEIDRISKLHKLKKAWLLKKLAEKYMEQAIKEGKLTIKQNNSGQVEYKDYW